MLGKQDEPTTKYTYGGEEFILVEFDEAMSLGTNLLVQQVAASAEREAIDGVIDVCPANLSYLVRFDPDRINGDVLVAKLRAIERAAVAVGVKPFHTRLVDVPVYYGDPWTHEVVMKFRDRVQDPTRSDFEYLAHINGFADTDSFVTALTSTPHLVCMTGFVPGVVWSYQLVAADRQLQGPKYLRPRTETPDRAFALGGAFPAIYPAPSSGGYPIFGRAAAPVYDADQRLADFRDNPALVQIGDIYNYRPIDRAEYDAIGRTVADGTFRYSMKSVDFEPQVFFDDPDGYCQTLTEALYS